MRSKKIQEISDFYDICEGDHIKYTPTLYTHAKTGSVRFWRGGVFMTDHQITKDTDLLTMQKIKADFNGKTKAVRFTIYGQLNGKSTVTAPTIITEGKNIGRSNETTPFQQALSEVMSDYNKRLKSGSTKTIEAKLEGFDQIISRPIENPHRVHIMLLHSLDWKKVVFPCYVQPKLDGIHAVVVYNGSIDIYTRSLTKSLNQPHISKALSFLSEKKWRGFYVTGELYIHEMERQKITSWANRSDFNEKETLIFNVFDVFTPDEALPFSKRLILAEEIVREADSPFVQMVETLSVDNKSAAEKYYSYMISEGYEGLVVRNASSLYEYGISKAIRSFGTMKWKVREDHEFTIIGFHDGIGKNKGLIIFEMETNTEFIEKFCNSKGEIMNFSVVPSWSAEERSQAFQIGQSYIGKKATVSFDISSESCVVVQPVLKEIYM